MSTLFFLLGLAAVAVGVALVYLPAGIAVGGGLLAWVARPVPSGRAE